MPKISALRANCGQIPSFCQISDRKNREEISNFRIWEGEKFGFLAKIFTLGIIPTTVEGPKFQWCYKVTNHNKGPYIGRPADPGEGVTENRTSIVIC